MIKFILGIILLLLLLSAGFIGIGIMFIIAGILGLTSSPVVGIFLILIGFGIIGIGAATS